MFFPGVFLLNVEASYKLIKFQRFIQSYRKLNQSFPRHHRCFAYVCHKLKLTDFTHNIHVVTTMAGRAFEQAWGPIWNRNGEGQKKKKKPVNVRHWIQALSNNHKRHQKKKKKDQKETTTTKTYRRLFCAGTLIE